MDANTPLTHFTPCLWLAADVAFSHGTVEGVHAPEVWRAAIKDEMLRLFPDRAAMLLQPVRTRAQGANFDCPGLVIECARAPASRLLLKFLGQASGHAQAVLISLESALAQGIGKRAVTGTVTVLSARRGRAWHPVGVPTRAGALDDFLLDPVDLSELGPRNGARRLRVQTRSRCMLTAGGKLLRQTPTPETFIRFATERINRVAQVWGSDTPPLAPNTVEELNERARASTLIHATWKRVLRTQRETYPSHGFVGAMVLEVDADDALANALAAGGFFHIGQQSSIGLGGYDVGWDD